MFRIGICSQRFLWLEQASPDQHDTDGNMLGSELPAVCRQGRLCVGMLIGAKAESGPDGRWELPMPPGRLFGVKTFPATLKVLLPPVSLGFESSAGRERPVIPVPTGGRTTH